MHIYILRRDKALDKMCENLSDRQAARVPWRDFTQDLDSTTRLAARRVCSAQRLMALALNMQWKVIRVNRLLDYQDTVEAAVQRRLFFDNLIPACARARTILTSRRCETRLRQKAPDRYLSPASPEHAEKFAADN